MPFGDYEDDTINRRDEAQDIRENVPVISGHPGDRESLISTLKARFAKRDRQKTVVLPITDKTGSRLWLELDLDLTEADQRGMDDASATGNRAQKRAGKPADVSREKGYAWFLNEKTVGIFLEDPDEGGEKYLDADGDPMTLHSEEWLLALDVPLTRPVDGVLEVFSYPALLILWKAYLAEVEEAVNGVDPTSVSSGV